MSRSLRPRPTQVLSIRVPEETLVLLERVAVNRDMSVEALVKFYIGQELRQDAERLFAEATGTPQMDQQNSSGRAARRVREVSL